MENNTIPKLQQPNIPAELRNYVKLDRWLTLKKTEKLQASYVVCHRPGEFLDIHSAACE